MNAHDIRAANLAQMNAYRSDDCGSLFTLGAIQFYAICALVGAILGMWSAGWMPVAVVAVAG